MSAAGPGAGTIVTKTVSCPGTVLVGGGAQFTTTGVGNEGRVVLRASFPQSAGVNGTWRADAVVTAPFNPLDTLTLVVYAVCA